MGLIDERYDYYCQHAVDIKEHLPTLKRYASECDSIVEMGVRSIVSTWALLSGRPKSLTSIDIYHPSFYGANIDEVYSACLEEGISFNFLQASTLEITLDNTDLLFIDTLHTYDQLSKELLLHGNIANKFMIFHDTDCCPELKKAIAEFMQGGSWKIREEFKNNNGLTVLERG